MKKVTIILTFVIFGLTVAQANKVISVNLIQKDTYGSGDAKAGATAGVVEAGYWNTIEGTEGTAVNNVDSESLFNNSGVHTGVEFFQMVSKASYHNKLSPSGFSGTIGGEVMRDFADGRGAYFIMLSGLHAGLGDEYDVYLYSARDHSNTGVTRFTIDGEDQFIQNRNLEGDYAEGGFATQDLAEENVSSGNYVKFSGITADTLIIDIEALSGSTTGGIKFALNGFQLVAVSD